MLTLALSFLLSSFNTFAAELPDATQMQYLNDQDINLIQNPGFESGFGRWTISPIIGLTSSTSDKTEGRRSLDVDYASGGSISQASTVTEATAGSQKTCTIEFDIKLVSGSGSVTVQVTSGGTLLNQTVTATSAWRRERLFFSCASTVGATITASWSIGIARIRLDRVFMGYRDSFAQVSQASMYGSITQVGASGCVYTETTSTGPTDYVTLGNGSGCNSWTASGSITNSSANVLQATATNMPAGEYLVQIPAFFEASTTQNCHYRITDGTNNFGFLALGETAGSSTGGPLIGRVSYSTAGTRTFTVQASDTGAVTCSLANGNAGYTATWIFHRFPTAAEEAAIVRVGNEGPAIFTGYHQDNCVWSTTSTTYVDPTGDSTCTFVTRENKSFTSVVSATSSGNNIPGIVITPPRAGRYEVCASAIGFNSTDTQFGALQLTDGTNTYDESSFRMGTSNQSMTFPLCGVINLTSTSPATIKLQMAASANTFTLDATGLTAPISVVNWRVVELDTGRPSPFIRNSLFTGNSGQVRMEAAFFTNSGTPTLSTSTSSWTGTITDNGTGDTTVAFAGGTFSSAPFCFAGPYTPAANRLCMIDSTTAISTSSVRVLCTNASVATDTPFFLMCMGNR